MVDDLQRTGPLVRAVKKAVKPGDVVADIGTGLGILAIAAAKMGAKRVWAIDCDGEALAVAYRNAIREKVSDRITFVEGLSFDTDIDERVDVIICETVGSYAFDENILATIADAKKRFLKRGGKIIPERLELWGAPIGKIPSLEGPAEIARVKKTELMGRPSMLCAVDPEGKVPSKVHVRHKFGSDKSGIIRAIALWPRIVWQKGEITDASPLSPPTHWKQGILPIEARSVRKGEKVGFELIVGPHPDEPRRMTERMWRWI